MKCEKCGHENKKGFAAFFKRHVEMIFGITTFVIIVGSLMIGAWALR